MIRRFGNALRLLLMCGDALVAILLLVSLSAARFGDDWPAIWQTLASNPGLLGIGYALGWVVVLALNGLYQPRARWTLASEAKGVLRSTLWMALATFAILFLLDLPDVSRLFLITLFPLQAAVTIATRVLLRAAYRFVRQRGRNLRNVLVVGTGETGLAFAARLASHPELGLRIEGFLGETAISRWPWLGDIDRLPEIMHTHVIDEVAICLPIERWQQVEDIAGFCRTEGKIVRLPMTALDLPATSRYVEDLDGMPVVSLVTGPDRVMELALKRLLDIVGGGLGLVILSPVFALAALAILIDDGRPVVFRQIRAGLNGRRFKVVKFRTMERDADAKRAELRVFNEVSGGASFKMTNDPRVTRVGQVLRRTSIDELPQLWNVLVGEMSLVGPRPHPLDDVAGYDAWHRRRLSMKPGMTGLWQIGARRDTDFDRWVQRDLDYIDHWSLWLDLKVMLLTIPALLRAEGR